MWLHTVLNIQNMHYKNQWVKGSFTTIPIWSERGVDIFVVN